MSVLHDVKMILSLSCDESSRLVSDNLERKLSRAERMALRLHLMVCRKCRAFRRNLNLLRDALHTRTEQCLATQDQPPALSSDERARLRQTLARAQTEES